MEKLDITNEITSIDDNIETAILPIMANISIPIRSTKTANRVREKMRIDEPLDNVTYQEHLKFEELCSDFRDFQDQLDNDENTLFPEEKFWRYYC